MTKVAFIGLGVMGSPMSGHLAAKGFDVTVFNRTAAKAEIWAQKHKGRYAPTPAEAAKDCDFVMTCVGNDNDLRQVTMGPDGVFQGMKAGAVLIDHTTASAKVAHELADAAKAAGVHFIDAPVSGGQAGAENGILTIMAGGEPDVYARAEPVLAAYGKVVQLMGPVGSGQLTKMVNQMCIAGVLAGMAEGYSFAQKAGLDMPKVIKAVSGGSAASWQMANRSETMMADKYDFGFAVDWIRKDLSICLDEARSNGASLPVSALIDQLYSEVQQMGGNRWDTSSLIKRYQK